MKFLFLVNKETDQQRLLTVDSTFQRPVSRMSTNPKIEVLPTRLNQQDKWVWNAVLQGQFINSLNIRFAFYNFLVEMTFVGFKMIWLTNENFIIILKFQKPSWEFLAVGNFRKDVSPSSSILMASTLFDTSSEKFSLQLGSPNRSCPMYLNLWLMYN